MPVLLAKKVAIGCLAVGSGYSGAVYAGSQDEKVRAFLEKYIPGYSTSLSIYSNCRAMAEKIWSKRSRQDLYYPDKREYETLVNERGRLLRRIAELQAELDHGVQSIDSIANQGDAWKLRYEEEKCKRLQLDRDFDVEVERKVASYLEDYRREIQHAIDKSLAEERSRTAKQFEGLASRADSLTSECVSIKEKYVEITTIEKMLSMIALLETFSAGKIGGDTSLFKRRLEELKFSTSDEFCRSICDTLLKNAAADLSLREFQERFAATRLLMRSFVTLGEDWLYIFPHYEILRGIGRGATALESHVTNVMNEAAVHLASGDLSKALAEINSIEGWPRVAISDLISTGRQILEFRQGMQLLKAYLLLRKNNVL